jgi:hypothetical protein
MSSDSRPRVFATSIAIAILAAAYAGTASAAYVNETGVAEEADFVNLQFPPTLTAVGGTSVGTIYGRIFENGVTPGAGASASVTASLGYGPAGSDPLTSLLWNWFGASFNVQVGNDDEYAGTFIAPTVAGMYSYTFRFSLDGGTDWTLADLDGAGSNAGLVFSPLQLGTMTVTAPPVPLPPSLLLMAVPVAALLRLGRRRATPPSAAAS